MRAPQKGAFQWKLCFMIFLRKSSIINHIYSIINIFHYDIPKTDDNGGNTEDDIEGGQEDQQSVDQKN